MDDFPLHDLDEYFSMPVDPSGVNSRSVSSRSSSSWSLEVDPQLVPLDSAFWPDLSSYSASPATTIYRLPETEDVPGELDGESFGRRGSAKKMTPAVLSRRRAQNRASQRAYRDRKDRRVKDLEEQLEDLERRHAKLSKDHEELCIAHAELKERLKQKDEKTESNDSFETTCFAISTPNSTGSSPRETSFTVKVAICKRCFGDASGIASIEHGV